MDSQSAIVAEAETREEELYRVSPSMFYAHPFWFVLTLILCLAVIGLIILWIWWLVNRSTQLIITSERVMLKTGLLTIVTDEVRHEDITNLVVRQGFLQRLGGVGDIQISSSAQPDAEIVVKGIPRVQEIAAAIRQHQNRAV